VLFRQDKAKCEMNKMNLRRTIERIPLTLKMVLLTAIVGITSWAIIDHFMVHQLKKDFQSQLSETLHHEAMEEWVNFELYINNIDQTAEILTSQKIFYDHVCQVACIRWHWT